MDRQRLALVAGAMVALGISGSAFACCPTGTGGFTDSGLGETSPPGPDLAADAEWQVYGFERAGIRHLQVNGGGQVRFAVGYIGETVWVVPTGIDADRVRLPGDPLPEGAGVTVYAGDLNIRRYSTQSGDVWVIESAER